MMSVQLARRLPALTFVFALVIASAKASAFLLPCDFVGQTSFEPFHPLPGDTVRFSVLYNGQSVVDPIVALSKVVDLADNQLELDIVFTHGRSRFPDYELANIDEANPEFPEVDGVLGNFPAGDYSVATSVYIDNPQSGTLDLQCSVVKAALEVYADSGTAAVVEYYHAGLDHYFMTQNADEIAVLDAGVYPGWARTGESFLAYRPGQTNGRLSATVRFYLLPDGSTHFYASANTPEDNALRMGFFGDWAVETADAFELDSPDANGVCPAETIPVYRLWNARVDTNHRYTTDPAIKAAMIARGYVPEGYGPHAVEMCAVAP